jgi:hypothetical protein
MYTQRDVDAYIREVRKMDVLETELVRIQSLMLQETMTPVTDADEHKMKTACLNQVFKSLLAEKARQKIVQQVRDDNCGTAENSSTGPAHDTAGRVRVRDILQQQISWC